MFFVVCLWQLMALLVISYVLYYLLKIVKRPTLFCADGPFKQLLQRKMKILQKPFWPTFWCVESRAQIFCSVLRIFFAPRVKYRREILRLQDGGVVALDWLEHGCAVTSHCLIIIPGVNCDSRTDHIRSLAWASNSVGVRAVVFNHRGTAGLTLKTPRLCSCSDYEDFAEVMRHVKKSVPTECRLSALGLSLGGLILGNYLSRATEEASSYLTTALMISVPFDIWKATHNMMRPVLNRLLNLMLTKKLCYSFKKYEVYKNKFNRKHIMASRSLFDYHTRFTSAEYGYASIFDYYNDGLLNAAKFKQVSVPLLCLQAADDPFQLLDESLVKAVEESTHVAIIATTHGSHICFLEGFWPFLRMNFMNRFLVEYLTVALLDEKAEFSDIDAQMHNKSFVEKFTPKAVTAVLQLEVPTRT